MRVFVSSVIGGMEEFREAAASAARILGHTPIVAEDFGANSNTPQVVCLDGVRQADVLVLLLGRRYGYVQSSGLSATHEEYREARGRCPVLVFVKEEGEFESEQSKLVDEVQSWESGHYTAPFKDARDLQESVIGALHNLELTSARGNVDSDEMLDRVLADVASHVGNSDFQSYGHHPEVVLALAGAPRQNILRPAEMESDETKNAVLRFALVGDNSLLAIGEGTQTSYGGDAIILSQPSRELRLTEEGSLAFVGQLPTTEGYLPAIIEEDILEITERFLQFATEMLSYVDSTNRLSHCAVALALRNVQYQPWRTRAEHNRNPNISHMPFHSNLEPVYLSPPEFSRGVMKMSGREIAHDLMVKLRRQLRTQ